MDTVAKGSSEGLKKKVILLIPVTFNDGTAVPEKELYGVALRLCELCGGASVGGTVRGLYKMAGGKSQADRNLVYWVWVAPSRMDALRDLVRQIGRELGQESMYFEVSDSEIEFIS